MSIREKLIELLHVAVCDYNCDECEYSISDEVCIKHLEEMAADYLIANGVIIQEWIPVCEPPKERGNYLCYFKFEPKSPNVVCENTYLSSGLWLSETDSITHWSHLPPPPKGE